MTDKTSGIAKWLGIVAAVVLLIALSYFALSYFLYGGFEDKPRHSMTCYKGEERVQEIREEWVRSDNITSYGDIKNQTDDLPQRINESLKANPSFWFTATEYENLSEKEKERFRRGLNGTRVSKNGSLNTLVLYQGDVYYCDAHRILQGA